MAQQERNVTNIIVNAATAALSAGGTVDTLNAGEVGVFTADGVRMTAAAAATATSFFLARGGTAVVGAANGYQITDLINVADMTPATSAQFPIAAVEQQDSIGYNGTSGSIEAINNNLYLVSIYVQEYLTSSTDGRKIKHFQYHSDATATQAEIAIGLAGSGIQNWSKEAEQYIIFGALCNDVGVTEADDITVVNGTRTVLAAGALTAVVGDFLRFGAPGVAATVADDTYRVVSIAGLAYTLDRPLQVASGAYATATADCQIITAALGAAADWGVDLQGQPLEFQIGKLFYKKARWESSLKDFGTTNSAREADALDGRGVGQEMAQMEWFLDGNEGETYRMGEPAIYPFTGTINAALLYTTYSISFQDVSLVGFENNISPKLLQIAIPSTITGASSPVNAVTGGDSLTSVLNAIPGITGVTLT